MKKSVLILFPFVLLLLLSCTKTVYVPVERTVTDVQYRGRIISDSIHTSDTVRVYALGDTVYIDKIKMQYKTKYVRDTAYVNRTDSIPYTVEVVKEKAVVPQWAWWTLAVSALFVGSGAVGFAYKVKQVIKI